jgi:hypothetical protein
LLSASAAKHPQTKEPTALNATIGCHTTDNGSSALDKKFKTKENTETFAGNIKKAMTGSGLPS